MSPESVQRPILPSISAIFREKVSSPFWLSLPANTGSHTGFKGPKLRPLTSTRCESVVDAQPFPSPALTTCGSPSSRSTDGEEWADPSSPGGTLDTLHQHDDAIVQDAIHFLGECQIDPPFAQGWFKPENEYNRRIEEELGELKYLEQLVAAFFYRDEARPLYGDRVTRPRRQASALLEAQSQSENRDPALLEKLEKKREVQGKHQQQEEQRRDRHRECQHDSHERCPEIAARCGAEHAREAKPSTRSQAGKGPGKDEQLYSSIYTQELAGRLVQALNTRLRRAEDMVRALVELLQEQPSSARVVSELRPYHREAVNGVPACHVGYVGTKRPREDSEEEEEQIWRSTRRSHDATDCRFRSLSEDYSLRKSATCQWPTPWTGQSEHERDRR